MRELIRLKHYSLRTEKTYLAWIRRFILFHDKWHPKDMDKAEVEAFLTDLAIDRGIDAESGTECDAVPVQDGAAH